MRISNFFIKLKKNIIKKMKGKSKIIAKNIFKEREKHRKNNLFRNIKQFVMKFPLKLN